MSIILRINLTTRATSELAPGTVHSPTPHWSELYDMQTYRAGSDAGTVAMPLWKIVQAAPYARDAQYGVLTLKLDSQYVAEIIPPVSDKIGLIGYGREDIQGRSGADRTFYTSPYDVPAEAPVESAPDGYGLSLEDDTYVVRLATDEPVGVNTDAKVRTIQIRPYEGERSTSGAIIWNKRQRRIASRFVQELQAESVQRHKADYVVPLRAGVMNFYVPDDGPTYGKPRASFTKQL